VSEFLARDSDFRRSPGVFGRFILSSQTGKAFPVSVFPQSGLKMNEHALLADARRISKQFRPLRTCHCFSSLLRYGKSVRRHPGAGHMQRIGKRSGRRAGVSPTLDHAFDWWVCRKSCLDFSGNRYPGARSEWNVAMSLCCDWYRRTSGCATTAVDESQKSNRKGARHSSRRDNLELKNISW